MVNTTGIKYGGRTKGNPNGLTKEMRINLCKFAILNTKNHLKLVKDFFNYKNTKIIS